MARTLILDSEALSVLAAPRSRGAAFGRARAVLTVAYEERAIVVVPSPVLAEVCRGRGREASVQAVLAGHGISVAPLSERMALLAGRLLHGAKLDSRWAVDAFVVAAAAELGPSVVATHDPTDIERFATRVDGVRVLRI